MTNKLRVLKSVAPYLTIAVLTATLLTPVMLHAVDSSDYKSHYRHAIDRNVLDHVRHPLFHETVRFYVGLLPSFSREHILLLTSLTHLAPASLPIFWWLRRAARRQLPDYSLILLVLGLVLLAPITLWIDNKFLLGYVSPTVYHSPTSNALRPFLVPLALLSLVVFECQSRRVKNRRAIVAAISAVLVVLATLAKPSYTIALLPGLCLFAGYQLLRQRTVDLALLVFGFGAPAAFVLAGLYFSTYAGAVDDSSIGFGFLTVWVEHVPLWRLPFQILLSIAFPLAVYLLYRAEARQHVFLNLSWVVFGVAAMLSLFVHEAGPRLLAGNFLWTSYSAVFVLMFASLAFLIEQYAIERESTESDGELAQPRLSLRFNLAMLIFGLHVVSGIAYYFRTMSEF